MCCYIYIFIYGVPVSGPRSKLCATQNQERSHIIGTRRSFFLCRSTWQEVKAQIWESISPRLNAAQKQLTKPPHFTMPGDVIVASGVPSVQFSIVACTLLCRGQCIVSTRVASVLRLLLFSRASRKRRHQAKALSIKY